MAVRRLRPASPLVAVLIAVAASPIVTPARARPPDAITAVAHRAGARTQSTGQNTPRAVSHRTGFPAAEPTLGISKAGVLYSTVWEPSLRVDIVRSKDDGATWETASPELPGGQNLHAVSFDPIVYADQDTGRVFAVDLLIACSYLSFSDDEGTSWTTNPIACGQPFNDHQSVFSGPPVTSSTIGYPNVVYYCFNDYGDEGAFCTKSLDGGLSFLPPGEKAYPAEDERGRMCGGLHGHGITDQDGTVYLPAEYCDLPFVAISKDEGATWKRVRVSRVPASVDETGNGPDPSIAVDDAGNLYYLWVGADRLPYLAVSRDRGRSWSKPVMVGAPGVTEASHASLAAGSRGAVAFAYMGSENSEFPSCRGESRCEASYGQVTWRGYLGMTTDALDENPLFFSAPTTKEPLIRGSCGPRRCGWVVDFLDIVIGPDGTPYGAFVDTLGQAPPDYQATSSEYHEGVIGRLIGGPSLMSGRDGKGN